MSETYFFRTIKDGARNRLRPMPFQKDTAGRSLITDLNVQADTDVRQSYPIGTVFASEMVEMRTGGTTPFYAAGDIFPVSVTDGGLASPRHQPTDEMRRAWNTYLAANGEKITPAKEAAQGVSSEGNTRGKPLSLLAKIQRNPKYKMPTIEEDGFWVSEEIWWPLMLNLIGDEHTLFTGPAGSGKTEIVQLACKRLGLKCHVYDMGSMYDPISEMLGVHRIAANGTSVFDYAGFTRDIQEEGVILLDELSRATPAVNNILLPCLDSRRELPVEMAGDKDLRRIHIHPKCRFVATANIGAEYTGVQGEMDMALKDRFDIMEMEYMPDWAEVQMLITRYKIDKTAATNIVNAALTVRSLAQKEDLQRSVSTRETIRCAKKVHDGFSAKQAMEKVFLPLFAGTKSDGERAVVWNAILSN